MKIRLTRKEVVVLELKLQGFQEKEIADELGISLRTVKYYSEELYRRLNVKHGEGLPSLRKMFGSYKVTLTWVPNPSAPEIEVLGERREMVLPPRNTCTIG